MYIFKVSKKKYLLLLIFTAAFFILKKVDLLIRFCKCPLLLIYHLDLKTKNAFFYFTNSSFSYSTSFYLSVTVLFSTFSI